MASNSITSNFVWKLAERILARGIEFIVSIAIARMLAPEDYGIIAMVLVFIVLADVFVTSGFSSALIQKKDANETDFSTVFYCSLALSFIIYGLIYICAPLIAEYYGIEQLTIVTRVFALKIPLSVYNSIQHAYVSRHMLFKRFFLSTLVGTVLSGLVGVYLAYAGWGVWALVAQYFVNTIGDTIILAITVPWAPRLLFDLSAAKTLMDYGWKILASNLMGEFFGQLRNLVVGKYFSAASLAIYNRGQQIPGLIYNNIGTSITTVMFPAMSNHGDRIDEVKRLTSKSTRAIAFLLFPIFGLLIVIARPLILLLLTEKWVECVPFLQIISLDYCVAIWGIGVLPAINAVGKSDVVLKLEFIKKPIFLILLVIGVKFGLIAVAITMVIYEIAGSTINLLACSKHIGYSMKDSLLDVLQPFFFTVIAGLISSIWGLFLNDLVALISIQVITYIIVYFCSASIVKNSELFYLLNIIKHKQND